MEIKQIEINDIPIILQNKAKNKGLTFLSGTVFFGAYENNVLLGFTGVKIFKNKNARFKSSYVLEEHRNKGIFKQLNLFRIKYCIDNAVKCVYSNSYNISAKVHIHNNAEILKQSKNITYLKLSKEGLKDIWEKSI